MFAFRLDPALVEAVKARSDNLAQAVEAALRLWLARDRRKAGTDPLAKHLALPTAREIEARTKDSS